MFRSFPLPSGTGISRRFNFLEFIIFLAVWEEVEKVIGIYITKETVQQEMGEIEMRLLLEPDEKTGVRVLVVFLVCVPSLFIVFLALWEEENEKVIDISVIKETVGIEDRGKQKENLQ